MTRVKILPCILLAFLTLPAGAQTIATVAGTGVFGNGPSGAAATATAIESPAGIATDTKGNFYFSSRVLIRKVDTSGIITTFAGGGTGTGNGIAATACSIANAQSVCMSANGVLYFTDRVAKVVRKVDTNGLIYTVAGGGTLNAENIPADSFQFSGLNGVAADMRGNIFISDQSLQKIFRVDSQGLIHTYAGYGVAGWTGDGIATGAALNGPAGLAVDAAGNLYVADQYNQRIRRIDTAGNIHTVVGSGYTGFSGDGGDALVASLDTPVCVALAPDGELYFGEARGNRIRYVNAGGIISGLVGNGTAGYSGDSGPATAAKVNGVVGIAVATTGGVLLADSHNNRIREVTQWPLRTGTLISSGVTVHCYPNPASAFLYIAVSGAAVGTLFINFYASDGRCVLQKEFHAQNPDPIDIHNLTSGTYFLTVRKEGFIPETSVIVIQ